MTAPVIILPVYRLCPRSPACPKPSLFAQKLQRGLSRFKGAALFAAIVVFLIAEQQPLFAVTVEHITKTHSENFVENRRISDKTIEKEILCLEWQRIGCKCIHHESEEIVTAQVARPARNANPPAMIKDTTIVFSQEWSETPKNIRPSRFDVVVLSFAALIILGFVALLIAVIWSWIRGPKC